MVGELQQLEGSRQSHGEDPDKPIRITGLGLGTEAKEESRVPQRDS